ncbi:lipopolysaccharide assembly protein LapA domain-containing protein [Paeniglutamicibacter sp. NPDC091659]|uniref:lipopolysaccharide assembly protein LapA domain-containing protein n=1 Tax=Paeniglutamicibacter sp. NPDC091659 TaxID=3364389 RepID=UPI0037F14553
MTEDPLTPHGQEPTVPPGMPEAAPVRPAVGTRAGVVWTFTVVALIVLVFLVVFMVQNQDRVTVFFLGFHGQLALGIAMLIAAVAGATVVAIAGAVRIIQLRSRARTSAKREGRRGR